MRFHHLNPNTRLVAIAGAVTLGGLALAAVAVRRSTPSPRPASEMITHSLPSIAHHPGPNPRWDRISFGIYADGTQADMRTEYAPHMLITGPAGSGKTVLQRSILFHCHVHGDDWNVVGIDLGEHELRRFAQVSNTTIATTLDETVLALVRVHNDMTARYRQMDTAGVPRARDLSTPPKATLVLIDEIAHLCVPEGAPGEEAASRNFLRAEALRMICDITRLGRNTSIHLVASTQRAIDVPADLRSNFDARINYIHTDDARLPHGRGLAAIHDDHEPFQTYYTPPNWYDDLTGN